MRRLVSYPGIVMMVMYVALCMSVSSVTPLLLLLFCVTVSISGVARAVYKFLRKRSR